MTTIEALNKLRTEEVEKNKKREVQKSVDDESLYEDKEEYKSDLDALIQNKGIKSTDNNPTTDIEFYETNGKCPVKDFIVDISDEKLKEKTVKNIYQLSVEGKNARPPLSKYIEDGIFELRSKQSSNIDRIFYFFVIGNKIVMTNGYIKKSQELDKKEFEKAKRYMNEYLRRKD